MLGRRQTVNSTPTGSSLETNREMFENNSKNCKRFARSAFGLFRSARINLLLQYPTEVKSNHSYQNCRFIYVCFGNMHDPVELGFWPSKERSLTFVTIMSHLTLGQQLLSQLISTFKMKIWWRCCCDWNINNWRSNSWLLKPLFHPKNSWYRVTQQRIA